MRHIDGESIRHLLPMPDLIAALKQAFCEEFIVPDRAHYAWKGETNGTFLVMPAWQHSGYAGVKMVTVLPTNQGKGIPTIQGTYVLFDRSNGSALCTMDAAVLTNLRTAATSALASIFLSRTDSKILCLLGAGSLAPFLIEAHCAVRPLQKVLIWSRNYRNAVALADQTNMVRVQAVKEIPEGLREADIISTATLAQHALFSNAEIRSGQHLDLVGAFQPNTQEVSDGVIRQSSVFIDSAMACTEGGDIATALRRGTLRRNQIKGDLFELCKGEIAGRTAEEEITLFKSDGHALEDLVAAQQVWEMKGKL